MERKKKPNTVISSPRRVSSCIAARHRRPRLFKNYPTWETKFKVKVVGLKREMEEMGKDQEVMAMQQMETRKKIDKIHVKCAQIRQETEEIIKRQASNHHLLQLIFNVLRDRNNGDSAEAVNAAATLREALGK